MKAYRNESIEYTDATRGRIFHSLLTLILYFSYAEWVKQSSYVFLQLSFLVLLGYVVVVSPAYAQISGTLAVPQMTPQSIDGGTAPLSSQPTFDWTAVPQATTYTVEVCKVAMTTAPCPSIQLAVPVATVQTNKWIPTTELPRNVYLYWHVRANSTTYGSSQWSATQGFQSPNTPPKPVLTAFATTTPQTVFPKFLWTTTLTTTSVTPLSYGLQVCLNSTCDASSIVVDINTTGVAETSTSPLILKRSFTHTNPLANATQYYWRVKANAGSANSPGVASGWTVTSPFKTVVDAVSLTAPLDGTDLTNNRPTFTWSAVTNANTYALQVSTTGPTGTFTGLTGATALKVTTFTPTADLPAPAVGQTQLYWRVVTTGLTGFGTSTSQVRGMIRAVAPNVPVLTALSATVPQATLTPLLKWTTAVPAGAITPTNWDVQIANDTAFTVGLQNFTSPSVTVDPASTAVSYIRTWNTPTLTNGTQYYWRVRSKASTGDASAWTAGSPFKTVVGTVTNTAPTNGFATDEGTPLFTWSTAPGANLSTYTVQYTATGNPAGTYVNLSTALPAVSNTSFRPTVALPKPTTGTVLYWRVLTTGVAGYGTSTSAPFSLTPAVVPPLPVLVGPAAATAQTVNPKLSWKTTVTTAGLKPDNYRIQISIDPKFGSTLVDTTMARSDDPGSTALLLLDSYDVTGSVLQPATQYYWRVAGVTAGDSTAWVPITNTVSALGAFKTQLATPVNTGAPTITYTFGANPTTIELGSSTTLSANVTGGTATGTINYEFRCKSTDAYVDLDTVSSFTCGSTNYTTVGTYYPQVRITRQGTIVESPATGGVSVIVAPKLVTTLTASPASGNAPLSVTLTATSTGGTGNPINYSYRCKNGDSFTTGSTQTSYPCTFTTGGTFVASVQATQQGSAGSSDDSNNVVVTAPTVTLSAVSASPTSGSAPLPVSVSATVGGTATGSMDFEYDCDNNGSFETTRTGITTSPYTASNVCTLSSTGTIGVRVTRQSIVSTVVQTNSVTVTGAPPATGNVPLHRFVDTNTSSAKDGDGTLSWSHTSTGSNRLLVVSVGFGSEAEVDATVKFTPSGGSAITMTRAQSQHFGGQDSSEIWYLKNQATTGTISVTFSGPVYQSAATATSFFNIDQTNPVLANSGTGDPQGGAVPYSLSVGSSSTGSHIAYYSFTGYPNGGNNTLTPDATTVTLKNVVTPQSLQFVYSGVKGASNGPTTFEWTTNQFFFWSASSIAIKPIIDTNWTPALQVITQPVSYKAPIYGATVNGQINGSTGTSTGNFIWEFYCNANSVTPDWSGYYSGDNKESTVFGYQGCNFTTAGTYTVAVRVHRQWYDEKVTGTITATSTSTPPAGAKTLNVIIVNHYLTSGNPQNDPHYTKEYANNAIKWQLEEASEYQHYKRRNSAPTAATLAVNVVQTINKAQNWNLGATPRDSYLNVINENNLCPIIKANNVDQVWVFSQNAVGGEGSEMMFSGPAYKGMDLWAGTSAGDATPYCNGESSFVMFPIGYGPNPSLHIFGHAMEQLASNLTNKSTDQFYNNKFVGYSGVAAPKVTICGDIHFPPGRSTDYDYINPTPYNSYCENWAPTAQPTTSLWCKSWLCSPSEYYLWWMENLPSAGNTFTYQTKKIPDYWSFFVKPGTSIPSAIWDDTLFINTALRDVVPPPYTNVTSTSMGGTDANDPWNTVMSWQHVSGGDNRLLLVEASYALTGTADTRNITGITYQVGTHTVALQKLPGSENRGTYFTHEMWYLVNPDAGTGTLTATASDPPSGNYTFSATSFKNINQTTPFHTYGTNKAVNTSGYGTSGSIDITSTSGEIVFAGTGIGRLAYPAAVNAGTGTDKIVGKSYNNAIGVFAGTKRGATGTVTTNWTSTGTSEYWASSAVSLLTVGGTGGQALQTAQFVAPQSTPIPTATPVSSPGIVLASQSEVDSLGATTLSWKHTHTDSSKKPLLLVTASYRSPDGTQTIPGTGKVSSLSYAGKALTLVKREAHHQYVSEIWALPTSTNSSIPSGEQTVQATLTAGLDSIHLSAFTYTGVDQTQGLSGVAGAGEFPSSMGTSARHLVTTASPSSGIIFSIHSTYAGGATIDAIAPSVKVVDDFIGNTAYTITSTPVGGTQTSSIYQVSAQYPWSAIAIALKASL